MGSGKTYEVVTVVIYGALARGRRVVSNIAGLNFEAMRQSLEQEGVDTIGTLVSVPHDEVKKPEFWLTDTGAEAFIQPGDLVVVDEVWRFWDGLGPGTREDKRPQQFLNFVRMHRQFPHPETGVTCDLVLITQDVGDIHRSVKSVVEETYRARKLTQVGKPESYRVDIFTGGKIRGAPLRQLFGSYDPSKFGFYKSHSGAQSGGADPRELNSDDRGNLLKGRYFKILVFAIPLLFVAGAAVVFISYRSLGNASQVKEADAKSGASKSPSVVSPVRSIADKKVSEYQVVGLVTGDKGTRVLLRDESGESRWLDGPAGLKRTAVTTEVVLPDGSFAVSWRGGK